MDSPKRHYTWALISNKIDDKKAIQGHTRLDIRSPRMVYAKYDVQVCNIFDHIRMHNPKTAGGLMEKVKKSKASHIDE